MGPLVSPEITEEFEYPQLRECIRMIKSKGKPVSLHIDGIILPYINDFIKMGFDIIHPIDPCGGLQDIYEVKKLYGDQIAIHGNIDVGGVLVFGTPDDIVMDVRRHLDNLSVGGGYVCSSSHNLTDAVGLEQFYAMRDTVQAYNYRPAAI
jgi:uroporphyrinogen decarboxylase